jgi:hypothetical protein
MSWGGEGECPVADYKVPILAGAMPTFFLGQFFQCAPHSWDDLPPERVVLDFLILSSYREIEAKEMDKLKREQSIGSNKGRTVRTTSDSDFFEKMNARLTENG